MFLRHAIVLLLVATLSATAMAQARPADGTVVARDLAGAGTLRVQGQRVAKLYLQSGAGLNTGAAKQQIELAVAQGDAELKRLEQRHAGQPAVARTVGRSASAWRELTDAAQQPYGPAGAERAAQLAEELSNQASRLGLQLESGADSGSGRLIDLSTRQNMLAQRLARLYMQAQRGDRSQGLLVDMEQTRKEFDTGLRELEGAPENTGPARDALGLARQQWIFFDGAVRQTQAKAAGGKPLDVVTTSERIQEVLAAVTAQYVKDFGAPAKAR